MQYDYRNINYSTRTTTQYDEGLRRYFLKIYQLMSAGLAITALSAIAVLVSPTLTNLMFVTDGYGYYMGLTVFGWLISFAPLGISLYFAFGYDRISAENAQILFWVYAVLVGISTRRKETKKTMFREISSHLFCENSFHCPLGS